MAPFDELQVLWQSQTGAEARAFDPVPLDRAFHRYGRRQDIINIVKSVLICAALVHTVVFLRDRPVMLLAMTLVLFCAIIALVAEWRIQRGIAQLNFTAPSADFVRNTIAHLEAQRNPYHTREYIVLFGAILIGYNLMALASWPKLTVERRITTHALATALPAVLYGFGRIMRAKRFNAEYRPLIQRLTVLRATLEERNW